jgi:branched-chain amino acid transport system substrate-binding protein
VLEDYAGAPDQAATVAHKLVTRDNAKIIFGPELSSAWVAAGKVLMDAKVMNITPTTSAVDFLGAPGGELLFKTHPKEDGPDGRVAGHVATFLQEAKPKTIAILLPQDPVGPIHTKLYGDAFKSAGVEVVYSELFDPNTTDFTPQLTKIRGLKPDALVTGYLDRWMTPLVRQATELGVTSTLLATPGTTLAAGEPYKDRITYVWSITTRNIEASSDPKMQKYIADFKAEFNKDPGPNGFYGLSYYDAIFLLTKALQDAGTVTDLPKIAAAAVNVKSYDGGVLAMHFDPKHEAVFNADVGVIRDGKVRYVAGGKS